MPHILIFDTFCRCNGLTSVTPTGARLQQYRQTKNMVGIRIARNRIQPPTTANRKGTLISSGATT